MYKQATQADSVFIRAIQHMDATCSVPDAVEDVGEWKQSLDTLVTALKQDGDSGYKKARVTLFREHEQLGTLYATMPREETQSDDPRFTTGRSGKRIFSTFTEDDIDQLPDIEYLLSGILLTSSVSMVFGESNTGKTFAALDLAQHIARGLMWQGRRVKQGNVLYIYAEGEHGMKPRLQAWRTYHNLSTIPTIRFIGIPVHLINDRQALLDTVAETQERYSLVVVDPYSLCATGTNQNDQNEVTKTLMTAHEIVREYHTHVMLVHHTNKSGGFNGTAAFKNHVDTMIELKREIEDTPTSPIIARCEKQRDAQYFADIKLQLEIVELGINKYTYEPVTSCVVVSCDTLTRKEAQAEMQAQAEEKEQQEMVDILSVHGELTTNKWEQRSKDLSISGRAFDRHIEMLKANGKIKARSTGKKGASIYYSLVKEELL